MRRTTILAILTLFSIVSVSCLYNETCTSIAEEPAHLLRVQQRGVRANKAKCIELCARADGCLFYRQSSQTCWMYKINDDAEYLQCGSLSDSTCLLRAPIRVPIRLKNIGALKKAKSAEECADFIKASYSPSNPHERFFEYIEKHARHPPGVCRIYRRRGVDELEYTKTSPNAYLCPKMGGIGKLGEACASSYDCEAHLYCSGETCQPRDTRLKDATCYLGRACADGFDCQQLIVNYRQCAEKEELVGGCVSNDDCDEGETCGLDPFGRRACEYKKNGIENDFCFSDEECDDTKDQTPAEYVCIEERLQCFT